MAVNEGARKTPEAIVISDTPDVCLTPVGSAMVPVPYGIVAYFENSIQTTTTVMMTADPVFNVPSAIEGVVGDEAGTGMGVQSGAHAGLGYCRVVEQQHTLVVQAEGQLVVYHNSKMWMNCAGPTGPGNTQGTVLYMSSSTTVAVDTSGAPDGDTNPGADPETQAELDKTLESESSTTEFKAQSEAKDEMFAGSNELEAKDSISAGVEDKTTHFDESLGDFGGENANAQLVGAETDSTLGYSVDSTGKQTAEASLHGEAYVARGEAQGSALNGLAEGQVDAQALAVEGDAKAEVFAGPDGAGGEVTVGAKAVLVEAAAEGTINITGKTIYDNIIGGPASWFGIETEAPDWADHGLVVTLGGGAGIAAQAEASAKAGVDLSGDEKGRIAYAEAELKLGFGPAARLKAALGIK